jgi:cytoskeletal protein CcmA (bactofilin family)
MQLRKPGEPSVKTSVPGTVIAEGSEVEGKFTFTGTATVNGRLRGEIISNDSLIVGEKGVVNASSHAGIVHISGEVVGDVSASERLELHDRCRVYGDVEAPIVIIEEGALLEGQCRMGRSRPAEPPQIISRDPSVVPLKRQELPR